MTALKDEAVTRISNAGVPEDLYDQVRRHFDVEQFVDLIIAISTGMLPGDYQPPFDVKMKKRVSKANCLAIGYLFIYG